jgi:hypothetical protein
MSVNVLHALFHACHLFPIVGSTVLLPSGIVAIEAALVLSRKTAPPAAAIISSIAIIVALVLAMPCPIARIIPVASALAVPGTIAVGNANAIMAAATSRNLIFTDPSVIQPRRLAGRVFWRDESFSQLAVAGEFGIWATMMEPTGNAVI